MTDQTAPGEHRGHGSEWHLHPRRLPPPAGRAGHSLRIAEFVADPDTHSRRVDIGVTTSPETWAGLYLGTTDATSALDAETST